MKSILTLATVVLGLALFNGSAQANPFGIHYPDQQEHSYGVGSSDLVKNRNGFGIHYPDFP